MTKLKTYVINIDCEILRYSMFLDKNKHMADLLDFEHITPLSTTSKEVVEGLRRCASRSAQFKKSAEVSNRLTMGLALDKAIAQDFDLVLILEDDAVFIKDAPSLLRGILDSIPKDMQCCYLGGYPKDFPSESMVPVSKHVFRLRENKRYRLWGAHAIVYNKDGMEEMSQAFKSSNMLADTAVVNAIIKKGKGGIVYPLISFQKAEFIPATKFSTNMHGSFPFKEMESTGNKIIIKQLNSLTDSTKKEYDLYNISGIIKK